VGNFQILSIAENNVKATQQNGKTRLMVELKCGSCKQSFIKYHNQTHLVIKTKKSVYCSRRCSGKKSDLSEVIRIFRR
jgi:hypothetical protein